MTGMNLHYKSAKQVRGSFGIFRRYAVMISFGIKFDSKTTWSSIDSSVSMMGTILGSYMCLTAYWIAFGPHGPRALPPPGENWKVFGYTMLGVGVSFVIFCAIRMFARPAPGTMNAQYQEMTNEYLRVCDPKPFLPEAYFSLVQLALSNLLL